MEKTSQISSSCERSRAHQDALPSLVGAPSTVSTPVYIDLGKTLCCHLFRAPFSTLLEAMGVQQQDVLCWAQQTLLGHRSSL